MSSPGVPAGSAKPIREVVVVPAASAVLLRDQPTGPEVLLLRRGLTASFAPGAWVFPGGRVDPGDLGDQAADEPSAELAAARRAAARETAEEAGLTIDGAGLTPLARWCPPATAPRRFLTWILLGRVPDQDVTVDGAEIIDHRWVRPADALAARDQGDLELLPPTWVTLWSLARHPSVADALATAAATPPELFETQFAQVPGGLLAIWHGDADYTNTEHTNGEYTNGGQASTAAPAHESARHRLWMVDTGWRYERTI
ncbi:NUDIX domain-containing protein [Frankia sp. CNm7]|uniref:NUDIX domain-containing protein n=1 Tax=Frankia nepalensis TaxID=1836974 RepID=A0A937R7E7_9ACTN|nr:NUDIX domain-containing protein [Frankia nepalensis]MBL7497120.1 NUDIX domain-containing protein [Frankia nepalensis]MBL7510147.1 NUDIX domain-containing protein [Frankia nepalensis]MBL7520282.1 NUDIX domain-containing protein [Frankia nepalensis]MBL7627078.1 NUDIX domain-containing protein [Frankia nepalensis]